MALRSLVRRTAGLATPARARGLVVVALLAILGYRSAAVWHNDITAWTRVVDRHPWSVTARTMLGRAYLASGSAEQAERLFVESTRINPAVPDPYLYLAEIYLDQGERAHADAMVERLLEVAPDHPEGQRLRERIRITEHAS